MLSMRVDNVISSLVKQLLTGDNNNALYFHIDCRLYVDNIRASRGLHLLYQKNVESSYIHTFSSVMKSPFDKIGQVDSWKHETSHDSCWRDINAFAYVYFSMADEINSQLPKAIAPIDMTEFNSFGGLTNASVFQWVPVQIVKDKTDPNNYRRIVTVKQA